MTVPRLSGLLTIGALVVCAILAAWLGFWRPINLDTLKEWQPLIAVVLGVAVLAFGMRTAMRRQEPVDIPVWLNVIFTFALAIFAFAAWLDAKEQLRAARDQVNAAREAQRAWLTIDVNKVSAFRLVGTPYPGRFDYTTNVDRTIKNIGRVPAQSVALGLVAIVPNASDQTQQLKENQQNTCARGKGAVGSTIFPDSTSETSPPTFVHQEDWPKTLRTQSLLYLVGCVIYRAGEDNKDHHTAFAYSLEPSEDGWVDLPNDPTQIDPAKIRLNKLGISDLNFAD
ncbi:hypothetical protein [Bradyrhizobium sp. NAS96.2]|uniref:hypothetical protein n=1 Tax=Bradyrhizobium sp. NAS96.2 TaxID=1680160 RepID=UPI00093C28DA|nr:hypothetical protein [Bradyrhizobium sp. NAS96.2]OKO77627.1 hypothetical protein AC628_15040 [Bradyrhizobium sp. NAS96.2]